MSISPHIRAVFGHFHNLNLLVLIHDLSAGRTARHAWVSGSHLCPVAHGLQSSAQVRQLVLLAIEADMDAGSTFAASQLGASRFAVQSFVRLWDAGVVNHDWLLRQLQEIWRERIEDAEAVEQVLHGAKQTPADTAAGSVYWRDKWVGLIPVTIQ